MSAFPQGYVQVSEARARQLREEAQRGQAAAARLAENLSMGDIARRQAEAERADDERRRTAGDPREHLRAAHQARAEAQAAVDRITPLAERGRQIVVDLEQRQREALATIDSVDGAAAARLVAAIEAGAEDLPLNARNDAARTEAQKIAAKLPVARGALVRLNEALATARAQLEGCQRQVEQAAVAVLIGEAVGIADAIDGLDATVADKRGSLDALCVELTTQQRRLAGSGNPMLPAKLSRVLTGPADRQLTGTTRLPAAYGWNTRFRALCASRGD